MRKVYIIIFLFIYNNCYAQQNNEKPYLVVLSMDGFRWDYTDSFPTPNIHNIIQNGVHAKSLIPVFPTITFPNHYSIATGLYPDHHGIVNNNFYDPDLKLVFRYNETNSVGDGRFYGGEPIWVTAQKQKMKTANFYWPGSEAEIESTRPAYWKKYNPEFTYEQRIDTVIHWLSLPEAQRPHLVMLYFDYPDHLTHTVGPFGHEVRRLAIRLDSLIGVLTNKLNQLPIGNHVNFIIVSDHGMENINKSKSVILNTYINKNWCDHINGHYSLLWMDSKQGYSDSIINGLSKAPHLKAWKKNDLPQRFHFGTNDRIGEIVLLADSSYSLIWADEKITMAGNHGYDNQNTDMYGIFYAIGPAFKKGYLQPSFENVNIYSLMTHILKLSPAKNDGNFELVKNMLKEKY